MADAGALAAGQTVHVKTDLFDATIDTTGGDLRGLTLSAYAAAEDESKPLKLLQNGEGRTYVAQTGLISAGNPALRPEVALGVDLAVERYLADEDLRRRVLISTALTLPVLVMAMVPAAQFDHWQWISLALASPVVVWGGWPFHRAAWTNLRHGAATMDTLISVGTLAAYGWSLYALLFTPAGDDGMQMAFDLVPRRGGGAHEIYLETAAVVVVLILAGRWFEARAKRRSGAALQALLELGAKDVAVEFTSMSKTYSMAGWRIGFAVGNK